MLRGEFIRGDGLVVPNNITKFGAWRLMESAFRQLNYRWTFGLCVGTPSPALMLGSLAEPTIGTNGYQRILCTNDAIGWPFTDELNGERFFETKLMTWAAAGGNFDKPIQRLFVLPSGSDIPASSVDPTTQVLALSAALPSPLVITPATPLEQRQFKYRLYLR